jgi:hypothetical protein
MHLKQQFWRLLKHAKGVPGRERRTGAYNMKKEEKESHP